MSASYSYSGSYGGRNSAAGVTPAAAAAARQQQITPIRRALPSSGTPTAAAAGGSSKVSSLLQSPSSLSTGISLPQVPAGGVGTSSLTRGALSGLPRAAAPLGTGVDPFASMDIDVDQVASAPTQSKYSSRLKETVRRGDSLPSDSSPSVSSSSGLCDELLGFTNIGNTCFMNSTLQCLLRTQRLRRFLLATDLNRVAPRDAPLTGTMQDICRRMFSSSGLSSGVSGKSIAPSNFKSCLASYRRAFAGMEQHDAHEFLRFTLDAMHDECNAVTRRPPYEELKDIDKESIPETASRWFENHTKRNASIVQDAFCGQFASETVCSECSHRSVSCETFLDLSLPIPRSGFGSQGGAGASEFSIAKVVQSSTSSSATTSTLQAALTEFFSTVLLQGDDAYRCPKCKKPTTGKRTTSIFRLPDVLVVHLKRFRHSRLHASKINDLVSFPVDDDLNVSAFLHAQSKEHHASYHLTGVVHHMGSVHSGHYIAHCKAQVKGTPQWFEFNDSSVGSIDNPTRIVSPSAYILFFEKSTGSSKL